jgi:hypothetical protein
MDKQVLHYGIVLSIVFDRKNKNSHTHTHTHIYIYIYIVLTHNRMHSLKKEYGSCDSSVDIATGYGLDGRGNNFRLLLSVQTASRSPPASYQVDTVDCLAGVKAAGA